jgi:hypothetical protein
MESALMQVVDLIPLSDGGGAATQTVARFSISLSPDVKITGFRLRRRPDATFTIAAPAAHGARVVHFAPALFRDITTAAAAAYGRLHAQFRACA